MMKIKLRLSCAFFLLCWAGRMVTATPVPEQNPFAPQQPGAPGQTATTPSSIAPNEPIQPGAQESNGLASPTPTNGPGLPEGLTAGSLSIWKQNQLTGDWGGLRDEMLNQGVAITPTWTGEVFGNPTGGVRQGLITDGLLNLALDLNLDRMSDSPILDNTLIHANAMYIYGPGLSTYDVGDFSNTSNIAFYNSVRLQELWLEKAFWQQRVKVKLGNIAVDTEFFQSSSASLFLNGTFGTFTLMGANVPNAPIYPLASPGLRVQFTPTSHYYVMAGVFGQDVNEDPTVNNKSGTLFPHAGSSGLLIMSEVGYLLNQSPNDRGLQGTYRLGSFVHTDNGTTFASQANVAHGTGQLQSSGTGYGIYGVMDQQLYTHGDQAISLFVRSGFAPSESNLVDYYVDGGFNFSGFIPGRDNDTAGLAIARSHVSDAYSTAQLDQGNPGSNAETVVEVTYKYQAAPWWSIQPDLQYVITPSGVVGSPNALVLGLRTVVAF